MWEYRNSKAGMAGHSADLRISSGYVSCFDIKAPDQECCQSCINDEDSGYLLGSHTIKTKHGDIEYIYCCKHISLIIGHEKERIEEFLDFKRKERGVNEHYFPGEFK